MKVMMKTTSLTDGTRQTQSAKKYTGSSLKGPESPPRGIPCAVYAQAVNVASLSFASRKIDCRSLRSVPEGESRRGFSTGRTVDLMC